ncbi:hypothetical protein POPTR_008G135860v4 [Populus trichocarpa]|uniref:Uncharacterized protein n=1 Tax=Populus trichocarpa TaxID=3694 RepID=A0ACC0SLJ5_POPTR|nr:uncharacterized protein LOC127905619 [Populus trichocarpa]KAI9390092.1 hypothetical protein POPTR_008G135860v4 [Populus trichocarpa]
MGSKFAAMLFIFMIFMAISLPPIYAGTPCTQPHPPSYPHPPPPNPPYSSSPKTTNHEASTASWRPLTFQETTIATSSTTTNYNKSPASDNTSSNSTTYNKPSCDNTTTFFKLPSISTWFWWSSIWRRWWWWRRRRRWWWGWRGGSIPGVNPPPTTQPTCPINALKLGACVDVLGGLVHVGLGNPVENVCCPVLKGLLELEAAICLCTSKGLSSLTSPFSFL